MKKKLLALLLAGTMVFSLVACGGLIQEMIHLLMATIQPLPEKR